MLLALVLYVGYPVYQSRFGLIAAGPTAWQLQERKERIYSTIKELELDHSLGKLADDDYARVRRELEAEAVSLLEQLDQLNGQFDIDRLRAKIDGDVSVLRAGDQCSTCGASRGTEDRFCSHCGNAFEPRE